ncbi:hypothetical protein B0H11DRAFT_1908479 [Mycena galericulata]|nr:hypothetical protein B0H11DRAFT_1918911 [Mycena galericulata]KAJ7501169.1 hypothetical protein B0H11DRAFT_1908479 [Mycena galericulata]
MFGYWSPVIATIIRWTPVAIAGDRGRGGPVKVNGDRRNPYLILAPTASANGHWRPPAAASDFSSGGYITRVAPSSASSQGSWVDRSPRWENPVAAPLKPGSDQ